MRQHQPAKFDDARRRESTAWLAIAGIAGVVMTASLVLVAVRPDSKPVDKPGNGVVVVRAPAERRAVTYVAAGRPPAATITRTEVSPEIHALILEDLQDGGASLRDVRSAGADGQVYCGELSTAANPLSRHFVWLSSVRMLAIDDGTADFADLVERCGKP